MAALSAEDMAILVRMAHLFSQYIKEYYSAVKEAPE